MVSETITMDEIMTLPLDLFFSSDQVPDIKRMARCLDVEECTIDRYLRNMKTEGLLETVRKKGGNVTFKLTLTGTEVVERINEIISETFLDPGSSGFAKKVPFKMILDRFTNPYERMEFLVRYFIRKEMDTTRIIEEIKAMRQDSGVSMYIKEVLSMEGDSDIKLMEEILRSSSIYSATSEDPKKMGSQSNLDHMILRAEVLRRTGSVKNAKDIYDALLQRSAGLESNRWLLCFSGSVQCMIYMNHEEEALKMLEHIFHSIRNPVERGFLNKIKADILQDLDRYQEASELYRSCLGIFHKRKYPVIRTSILNNLGVQYFRKDETRISTELWEDAFKIAKGTELPYLISIISINLADAYGLNGRFYKAEQLLRDARKVLRTARDLEGLSGVDFNQALVSIEKGEKEKAVKYFNKAQEFPLSY
ncbi:MAG: tetratricopeptide repeat protein, partial [Candidatus Thermoplasmatota archaeon]|nr:tetratricopeptide repeat protein [Candidatus Thermoplasmatota archaeon]